MNDSTGTLLRGASYEDWDFRPVGGKVFPRFLSFLEHGTTVVKVNVNDLVAPAESPLNSFTPVVAVSAEAGCMNPMPYRRVKSLAPQYPPDALQRRVEGTVVVDVWIGTDGFPRIRKVTASPNASLERATVTALTGWRYEPATCEGRPVQVETVLRVNYILSP